MVEISDPVKEQWQTHAGAERKFTKTSHSVSKKCIHIYSVVYSTNIFEYMERQSFQK